MASEVKVPRLLTVKQLADLTGLPVWRIHQMCSENTAPPHLRIGKTIRFPEDAVVAWIQEQSTSKEQE